MRVIQINQVEKFCKYCNVPLTETNWYKAHQAKRYYKCSGCCVEDQITRRKDNLAEYRAREKAWRDKNPGRYRAKQAEWRDNNREYLKLRNRRWWLKVNYNLTLEQFEALLQSQNNVCAICQNTFTTSRDTHVDHCHTSLSVRGILCGSCNQALGLFKDSINSLERAIRYLNVS